MVSYLHRVEADRADAVYTPGKGADRGASLLIPDVHLLATCCKYTLFLMMVQSCENSLTENMAIVCFSMIHNHIYIYI